MTALFQVKSEAEDNVPGGWLPEQHVHENPKQMMLGCRKGVQWFGNAAKVPLFQDSEPLEPDNIMEGSLLRFRCDYHLNRQGEIAQAGGSHLLDAVGQYRMSAQLEGGTTTTIEGDFLLLGLLVVALTCGVFLGLAGSEVLAGQWWSKGR
eukprot:s422_g45.t1